MKQIKLLGVMALALTLGLAACNNSGDNGSEAGSQAQKSSKHSHSWGEYTVTKAATCTEDGTEERECSVCHEKQTKTIKAAHTWGEYTVTKEATCAEVGSKERECSVCHAKDVQEIAKADHSWGDWETITAPDCTNEGSRKHVCSVCTLEETEVVPANGHTWGEWEDIEAATCTTAGSRKHKCSVCETEESETVAALGHDIKLIGDDEPAPEGKAKVRLYSCANGCDTTYFGFKATEVSPNAGRLVFEPAEPAEGQEQGARFWGRPIGNKMELDENGSATARPGDLAAVFDETVEGDLFEYVFDLTEEQVNKIGDPCLLYCDAKPADYLGGQDFWACDPNAEEWTPGMYIEGDKKGEPIENYRYILYVDGAPVEFDPTMKAPVQGSAYGGSTTRGEFVMPYKFHLHTGENKISLRMAGGYRSLFYNFTFRAVEAEEPQEPAHTHAWVDGTKVEKTGDVSAYTPGTCECGKNRILVDVASDLNGKITAKGGKIGANGDTAKYVFPMASAKAVQVMIKVAPDQSGNLKYGFHTGKNGGSSPVDPLPDNKTNTTFKVNGTELTIPAGSYQDLGATGTTEDKAALVDLGVANLIAGNNEFTITRTDSYAPYYFEIMFIY